MNKRTKKKRRKIDINDVCQGIKEMMTVKDHSVLILHIDPDMTMHNYRQNIYNLDQIMDILKNEHGITTIATMGNVLKFEELDDAALEKLQQEYSKRELEQLEKFVVKEHEEDNGGK
jgi:hypothetical protein